MKLLFVAYLENDATVRCVQQLQAALLAQGVQSDLLTFRWDSTKPLIEDANCGTRYRADTWYRNAQLRRDENGRIAMPWHGYLRVAITRGLSILLGGVAYQEQGFPFFAGVRLGRRMRTLCKQNHYTWVVSVSYPFMIHRLVKHYRPEQTHWAMYALDPFYANATYSKTREPQRQRLERSVSKAADVILYVPEQAVDYQCPALLPLQAKYHALYYPNFVKPEPTNSPNPLRTQLGCIDLVYLGTLYAEIRTPDALLALFERMHAKSPMLRLHLIGPVFGVGAGETVARYKLRLGDALQTYLPLPADMAKEALVAADVLVNIGNTVHNQMPSKLWEYIVTGKPILAICMVRSCNTLPYLALYPHHLCIFADETAQEAVAVNAVDFCLEKAKTVIDWKQLSSIYPDQRADSVAGHFIDILFNAEA